MISLNLMIPVIGFGCLVFFAAWLIWPREDSLWGAYDSLTTGILAFVTLLAVPMCIYMTWHQVGAKERLMHERLPVSADLGYVIGAQGGRAPRFIWRFKARVAPEVILKQYETLGPATGWKIERRKNGLLLQKPEAVFAVWIDRQNDEPEIVFEKRPPGATK